MGADDSSHLLLGASRRAIPCSRSPPCGGRVRATLACRTSASRDREPVPSCRDTPPSSRSVGCLVIGLHFVIDTISSLRVFKPIYWVQLPTDQTNDRSRFHLVVEILQTDLQSRLGDQADRLGQGLHVHVGRDVRLDERATARSIALATTWADPGGVRNTTRLAL